jgi:glutamate formiminotransferase
MDADHNRSVLTFAGSPASVASAAVRAVKVAAERIDLTKHSGGHPRIGAADVVPFVPVEGVTLAACANLAHQVGEEIWRTAQVPVYFYEAAARRPHMVRLEQVRQGQFEGLRASALSDPLRAPDVGGPGLHPTAGAVAVGARTFLIAYNVNLATTDLTIARSIARQIRASSGGFADVKALGIALPSRGQVQVSMNLTDFQRTPVHVVYEAIRLLAAAARIEVAGSEIIGLIPREALERAAEFALRIENFAPEVVLERRISEALPLTFADMLGSLEDPARAAGGGAAAALAAAMAASLGVLVCRLMNGPRESLEAHREFFLDAARQDEEAFASLMRTSEPAASAIREAAEVPLRMARRARELELELEGIRASCPPRFASDVITALGLVAAAKSGAASTARLNLNSISDENVRTELESQLRAVE